MKYSAIKDMRRVKKPRERLMEKEPEALRDSELLAILLGSGYKGKSVLEVAKRILTDYPPGKLATIPFDKLRKLKGIGPAKACLIKAAFELSKRAFEVEEGILPVIKTPRDAAAEVSDIHKHKKENFVVLYLNARNQVIGKETISIGTLNASVVHPREVFQPTVSKSAASIILAHNHPSGETNPSDDDIELTKRMVKAELVKNLIVVGGRKGYLRVANIKPDEIDETGVKYVPLSLSKVKKNIHLKVGDVLLTRKGTFGVAASVENKTEYIISSEVFRTRLTEVVSPSYFVILNNPSVIQEQNNQKTVGAIMGSLSQQAVTSIRIPLPPFPIQEKIAKEVQTRGEKARKLKEEAEKNSGAGKKGDGENNFGEVISKRGEE